MLFIPGTGVLLHRAQYSCVASAINSCAVRIDKKSVGERGTLAVCVWLASGGRKMVISPFGNGLEITLPHTLALRAELRQGEGGKKGVGPYFEDNGQDAWMD